MDLKKIKKALISVSDKSNLKLVLPVLKKFNIEIISSGGSFKKISRLKYNCTKITSYTGFPEILNGRVKTLHPKIHAGILNIRKNKNHRKTLQKHKINNIDLVIVDLYPFENKIDKKKFKELIDYIDIGGATLIRAAAKNFEDVVVISNTNDYEILTKQLKTYNGSTSFKFRKLMASKAFNTTAYYDSVISNWFNDREKISFPEKKTVHGKLIEHLRYGENPHQRAGLYTNHSNLNLNKIYGKKLSYNNYNDIYSAFNILGSLKKNHGSAIIKHSNPSGVSAEKDQILSFKNALMCDPVSAFGGVVGVNSIISKKLALELSKIFF